MVKWKGGVKMIELSKEDTNTINIVFNINKFFLDSCVFIQTPGQPGSDW